MEDVTESVYAIKFIWRIEDFSRIRSEPVCSDVFFGGRHKWRMVIHASGVKLGDEFSIALEAADTEVLHNDALVCAKCRVSIFTEDEGGSTHMFDDEAAFDETRCRSGWESFLSFEDNQRADFTYCSTKIIAEVWFNRKEEAVDSRGKKRKFIGFHHLDRHAEELDAVRKACRPAGSMSGDDALLKQCMERLNTVKADVSAQEYKRFMSKLVESRDMRLAFMSVPAEMVANTVKEQ